MSAPLIVTEPQIMLAAIDWLAGRGILPLVFSISGGTPEERAGLKVKIHDWFKKASKSRGKTLKPEFSRGGPDIEAFSSSKWWRIECKGTGRGKVQTQRNSFDRALASVVWYYTDEHKNVEPSLEGRKLYLGLALPDSDFYMHELRRRLGQPLRECLNLWILLYGLRTARIRPIAPDEDIV